MTATFSISVVVPVYNEARRLEALIASLRGQDYTGSLELVFVDGDSTDGSLKILQDAATESTTARPIVMVHNPKRNIPTAMNLGIRAATGDIIIRVDGHSLPPPEFVSSLVSYLTVHPGLEVVYERWEILPSIPSHTGRALAAALMHWMSGAGYRSNKIAESWQLLIIGDGPERISLETMVHQLSLQGMIRFVGLVERDDVWTAMSGARVMVLPSTWYENSPVSMIEAYCAGVVPVVSNWGGCRR